MTSFSYQVAFRVVCGRCSREEVSAFQMAGGLELPRPLLPNGWCVVDGVPLCEDHEVRIVDRSLNVTWTGFILSTIKVFNDAAVSSSGLQVDDPTR